MVRVRKRLIDGNAYYYLEHSARHNGKVIKREVYLGRKLPRNLGKFKEKLGADISREKWHPLLYRIKDNYNKEVRDMPVSARKKEVENFAVQFTYDTQRIEGSTLTLRETANLFERRVTPQDRPISDVKEAEAHRRLFYEILKSNKDLSLHVITDWHRKLFYETKPDIAGSIRRTRVGIAGSRFVPPLPSEVYPLLREFFGWYQKSKERLHPVELAALVHLKFVTIHPFSDGNGRISRLMMNFVLNNKGYPMLSISYEGRNSYYNALERTQVTKRDEVFVLWFIKRYIKSFKAYT
ncbi:MAG: Fic family protein [Nitrososphaera sp.]|nr:Fic family protein [Nitrososphaera sp.]